MRRRRALAGGFLVLVLVTIGVWSRAKAQRPTDVDVAEVRRSTITASFTADGVVKGRTADLAPRIAGRITAILVVEGQAVRAGQMLVQLDDRELRAGVREAEAAVGAARTMLVQAKVALALAGQQAATREAQARAQLAAAEAQLAQVLAGARSQEIAQAQQQVNVTRATLVAADQALRRARELHATGGLARAELDELEARYAVARAQHESALEALALVQSGARPEERAVARAQVEAARAQLEAARNAQQEVALRRADVEAARARLAQARAAAERGGALLNDAAITAPFAGVVTRIPVEVGQLASPLLPTVTLVDPRDLWVSADVADEDAAKVGAGQDVIVTAPAYPGRQFRGQVVELAPQAELKPDAAVRTRIVRVKVRLRDGAGVLRPGLEVDVEGRGTVAVSALVMPSDALLLRENRTVVFVVEGGIARQREVRVGYSAVDVTEVLAGLRENDLVVVAGKDGLTDGRRVRVVRGPGL